jgi:hypothetical protein
MLRKSGVQLNKRDNRWAMQQNRGAIKRCRCHKITPEKSQERVLFSDQSIGAVRACEITTVCLLNFSINATLERICVRRR